MKLYRIAIKPTCPEEYGYNLSSDNRAAAVNWNKPDVQICGTWTEAKVKQWLGLPNDAVVYQTLADINDLNESLVEEEDVDVGGYDWSELQISRSLPPPIVITRRQDGSVVINDGNHRTRFWREQDKQFVPAWCYDELMTNCVREQKKGKLKKPNEVNKRKLEEQHEDV